MSNRQRWMILYFQICCKHVFYLKKSKCGGEGVKYFYLIGKRRKSAFSTHHFTYEYARKPQWDR